MKKRVNKMAMLALFSGVALLAGCSPKAWCLGTTAGAVGGYLTSLLFPVTTTEQTCYVDGVQVDCSSASGKCIGN
jgi:hypothetical protein